MEIKITVVSSFPLEETPETGATYVYCPNCGAGMIVKELDKLLQRIQLSSLTCIACGRESKIILSK